MAPEITTLWALFVAVASGMGIIVAFVKAVEYLFQMTPVSKLEKRVSAVEEHDKKDLKKIEQIEERITDLEHKLGESDNKITRIDESITKIGKSQILLLRHFATGNGQQEMAEEADDLMAYFLDRR